MSDNNEEMIIDTSKMNAGKRAALEVAEAAREEKISKASFGGDLFMGDFKPELMHPFPKQTPEDKAIGDKLVEEVSSYLEENLDPEEVDETRTIPPEVVDGLAKMGLFAMKVAKEYNGLGLSQVNYNRVMLAVSSWCGSTAVLLSAHQSIGVPQPLKMFGTKEQKEKFLPMFREGKISAFALTEPGVGSDPAQMQTEATLSADGKHYVISGEKLWCTNGPIADILVVMAKTEPIMRNGKEIPQITAFIVEKNMPGFTVAHRCDFMGIRGINNGLLKFDNVKVPVENIILEKGKGLKLALATLNTGRLTLPAACTGMAKQCLQIARRWGNERVQWGASIGKHEAGSRKISYIASHSFAMEAVTFLTSSWADDPEKDIRIEAAMAKMFCSEVAWKIVDETMQLRGGRGYEKASSLKARGELGFGVERMMRECRINRIIEGTTDIMQLFLAREAMDPHLRIAADLIKKHSPMDKKLKAGVDLAKFYSTWYPNQWVNSGLWNNHSDKGALSKHYSFVEGMSHKLARTIFHFMGLYQDRLERKQVLLGNLIDIGTELFAMTATCSFALQRLEENPEDLTPKYLADVFCLNAEERVEELFNRIQHNSTDKQNKLARSVLEGDIKWLEEGIIKAERKSDV
jgi:alkylation response protein AidB-like acyl-CoA dehydrogenase